jgi:two-component system response regulator FixJ
MPRERRVYIVDDDEAVRDSLSVLLASKSFATRSFGSGPEFLATAASLPFGCLIVDIRMPEMDGLQLQQHLTDRALDFPLIVISGHGDVPLAVRAMKAGAVDFIEKPFEERSILDSLRQAQTRFAAQRASAQAGATAREKLATLTPREREVFDEMVRGKQNKMIAFDLDISPRTVEVHRARVLEKLEARSLSELVRLALAAGVPISS